MSSFSLADLCDLAEVTPRTVRYYIAQGLLRPPVGAGPAARYDDGHLHRLRLIRMLQREHLPLAEIRARLESLADAEVERLATEIAPVTDSAADYVARVLGARGVPTRRAGVPSGVAAPPRHPSFGGTHGPPDQRVTPLAIAAQPATGPVGEGAAVSPPTASPPARSQWERIALDPDLELHLRRPLSRLQNRRVDRLLEAAREIFKEEDR